MRRSLALSLHLLIAGKGGARDETARSPRPAGPLIWLRGSAAGGIGAPGQIARRLEDEDPDATALVTVERLTAPDMAGLPAGSLADADPGDRAGAIAAFLDHWRPDAVVLTGESTPPALVSEAETRQIPLILSDHRSDGTGTAATFLGRSLSRSVLPAFRRIFVPDAESALRVRELIGPDAPVTVAGRLEETADPLSCNEAERDALAASFGTRPVWCAADVPLSEADAVLAAHGQALRMAHRMLLVLVPQDAGQAGEFAARAADQGMRAALRSHDDEVDDEIEVLIADTEGEYGLWYRLSPVTYIGGSLSGDGPGQSPLDPAALGSAVIAGPKPRAHLDDHARLAEARALRLVRSPPALAEAVADLIAPDRAAQLAHNAWVATSGGAEAANAVVSEVLRLLHDGGSA